VESWSRSAGEMCNKKIGSLEGFRLIQVVRGSRRRNKKRRKGSNTKD